MYVYSYTMLTGLNINDQVLKAYNFIYVAIALCSIKFYSYAVHVVHYHGWHLNDINGPLM